MDQDDSTIIGRYPLGSGLFSVCTGVWDKNKQKFVNADSSSIMKCCIDRCIEPNNSCHEICKRDQNSIDCHKACEYQRSSCTDSCELEGNIWGPDNPFVECAKDKGCWKNNNVPDSECIKVNKRELIDCCRRNCIPTRDIDCQKHCEYSFDLTAGRDNEIKLLDDVFDVKPPSITYTDNTSTYVWSGIVTGIILGLIVFFLLYRK